MPEVPMTPAACASGLAAAAQFRRTVMQAPHLPPRMKELVLLALHASPTSAHGDAVTRQVRRARAAGASENDVVDVLLSIVGVANHALYFAVPVLLDELAAAGHAEAALPEPTPAFAAIRDDFVRTRGFWNPQRDQLGSLMPRYFEALNALSTEPWRSGSLQPKERELVYIAIDASVTHMYEDGLRLHIRHALGHGATRDEILEVFQLVALMGLQGLDIGARAMGLPACEGTA